MPARYGWNTPVTAPGPDGGSMLRNVRAIQRDPLTFLYSTWQKHGDVVQLPIPKPACYLVSSPQGARDILVNHHPAMSKRTLQYTTLSLVTGDGLLTADTQAWRPRRRMLQPAFHKDLIELTDFHTQRAIDRLNDTWNGLSHEGPFVVDVDQAMMELALDVTGAALFGVDLSGDAHDITQATLQALHGVIIRAQNPLSLPLAFPTPNNRGMKKAIRKLDKAIDAIIQLRSNDLLAPDAPIRDMLDVLLDSDLDVPLTREQIRDEIATFIVAGHETVASGLTWALHLLSRNIEVQQSLAGNRITSSSVFDEALRLYPPAWVITRRTLEDIEVSGFQIPANSLVIVSPWLVHQHPQVWSNPQEFQPERFADGAPHLGYLPFGQGPRMCIGKEMAMREGALVLSQLVQNWQFESLHSQDVAVEASVTLRPAGGLPLRIRRR